MTTATIIGTEIKTVTYRSLLDASRELMGNTDECYINLDFDTLSLWKTREVDTSHLAGLSFKVHKDYTPLDWRQALEPVVGFYNLYTIEEF